MKTTKRLLIVLLAMLMLVSSLLVGCKKEEEEADDTTVSTAPEGETYETDEWGQRIYDTGIPDELDYGNKDVYILIRDYDFTNVRKYEWYAENFEGDSLNQAIYYRNIEIEEELGVNLEFPSKSDAEINQYITNSFATGGEGIDIISNYHYYGTSTTVMESYKNLMHEDMTYLHLDHPYWNQNFINTAKSNDRLFVVIGDMNLSAYMTTFSMYFNKTLLDQIHHMSDEDMYEIVLNGDWTWEKMLELTKNTAITDGVDGDSDGDIYGLTSHYQVHAYDGMLAAFDMDLTYTDANGNHKFMTVSDQKTLGEAADKLVNFYRSSDVYLVGKGVQTYTQPVAYFKQNRSLFCIASIGDSQHLKDMTDEYGLLTLPKYNSDQENYYGGVQDSHNTMAVMYGDKDYTMISAVLELFASKSYSSVRPTLFEKVLKTKYLKDGPSGQVFDLVLAGSRWDFTDIYPSAVENVRNTLWRDAIRTAVYGSGDGAGAVSTAIAKNKDRIVDALTKHDEWLYTHY